MWHKNKRGPKTVPWGTPESTDVASEVMPSKTTCICLLVRKEVSNLCISPVIP